MYHIDYDYKMNAFNHKQILATLPVTTATNERSFSNLRYLKNYLRSTMEETRLTGLAQLYVCRDVKISVDSVIENFALKNKRRLDFVL